MMMTNDDPVHAATVPSWMLPLVQQVAEIRALTASIPKMEKEIDEMRNNIVPMSEHKRLMDRSDTLWDDRSYLRGSITALKWVALGLSFVQGLVLLVASLGQLGFSIHAPK